MKKKLMLLLILLFPFQVLAYSSKVILGGENVGIKIQSNGIMVVGFYKVNNKINSAKLSTGDYIMQVENTSVETVDDLIKAIEDNIKDNKVKILYRHSNELKEAYLELEQVNDTYKTGLLVKDSLKGLGTLTYIDPETKIYGCLGHEIVESNTNKKIEIKTGSIFKSNVSSITRSKDGNPGTKNAKFYEDKIYGDIKKNEIEGIYGTYTSDIDEDNLIEIENLDNVHTGKAYIYTALDDNKVNSYEINILRIDKKNNTKNIYFEVVDNNLINKTGGIVQGMSGSPIIQDNKLIAAVTHVSIDSVKKGYAISIINMLETGEK